MNNANLGTWNLEWNLSSACSSEIDGLVESNSHHSDGSMLEI